MVKARTIIVLAIVAAVSLALAAWSWRATHNRIEAAGVGEPLIAGLAKKGPRAARIEIALGESDRIALKRDGDAWKVEPSGYPADAAKVRKLLLELVQLRKAEPKTRKSENYGILELDEPGRKGAKGARVTIRDDKGNVLADVILGKPAYDWLGAGKKAQYARLAGEAQSWLVEGRVRAVPALTRWVDHFAVNVSRDDVVRGKIVHADGETLEVRATDKKAADGEVIFEIVDKPPAAKAKQNYQIASVARDMARLDFELVRRAKEHKDKPIVRAEMETKDGAVIAYDVWRDGEALWVGVSVLKDGKNKALAEKIRKTTRGWEYGLSETRGSYFLKRLKDVIVMDDKAAVTPEEGKTPSAQ